MPLINPNYEVNRLVEDAIALARKFHEVCLVVVCPPPKLVSGSTSTIPYATLLSVADADELAAPGTLAFNDTGAEVNPTSLRKR